MSGNFARMSQTFGDVQKVSAQNKFALAPFAAPTNLRDRIITLSGKSKVLVFFRV